MTLRVGSFIVLFSSLVLPVTAQGGDNHITNPGLADKDVTLHATINLIGPNGAQGGAAPTVLQVSGGVGGSSEWGNGGSGSAIQLTSGTGGTGYNNGGLGGSISLSAGDGGYAPIQAGNGGSVFISAGSGASAEGGGNGGSITLQAGAAGSSAGGSPTYFGNIILSVQTANCSYPPPSACGGVGIGNATPSATLDVIAGGSTLADAWTTRSSRRFKMNIQPLEGALEKIERLQGVSYERRADGKHEIGVVAEDVDQIVPEVVSRDPKTNEVQGVDYSRLTALLIEAVKSQQAEIRELKARINQLTSRVPAYDSQLDKSLQSADKVGPR